jgi:hypothetical protein
MSRILACRVERFEAAHRVGKRDGLQIRKGFHLDALAVPDDEGRRGVVIEHTLQ